MTENDRETQTFLLPDVPTLPFFERPVGCLLSIVLGLALLAVLAYFIRACTPAPETVTVVVAASDLSLCDSYRY